MVKYIKNRIKLIGLNKLLIKKFKYSDVKWKGTVISGTGIFKQIKRKYCITSSFYKS